MLYHGVMKTQDAIAHFGSAAALARAANITKAAVSQWGDLVPLGTAVVLQDVTQGALALDVSVYRKLREEPRAA